MRNGAMKRYSDEQRKLFRHRLQMENNRRIMSKKKKNTVAITLESGSEIFQAKDIVRVLEEAMKVEHNDIEGIQVNCFRRSQVEVTFKDEVPVDINELSRKVKAANMPYTVSSASFYEETAMIYGLPFGNIDYIKTSIRNAIAPFVAKIIEITPCTYNNDLDFGRFFAGKLNGNWRVRVEPKEDVGIPNFIVVGKECVQGKVVYGNKATVRIQQCANCYQDDHILNSDRCTGLREWQDYCKEFEEKKRAASLIQTRKENEHDGEENAGITNDEGMSRLGELEDAKRENESLKNKLNEAETRAAIHLEEQEKKMEEVVANMNEKAKEMKDQLEKMKKQEEASEEKIKDERNKSNMKLKEKESEIIEMQIDKKKVEDELVKLKEEC